MDPEALVIGASVLLVLVFTSGFMLTRKGSPYPPGTLTAHKVISIAVVVLLILVVINGMPFDFIVWVALVAAALFFVVSVATGGMISSGKEWPASVTLLHRISPWLTIASVFGATYLLAF
jgi:hypothetical protein